jgi:lipopolysaccharide transport system ATP-binding protein
MSESDIVLKIDKVAKGFRKYNNEWDRLKEWIFPTRKYHTTDWLYKDISFSLKRGEAIGLVGVNGAGKSTLLKMIVGTSPFSSGSIKCDGSIAAILELGMGFQADFTGRQNAIMAGQLMGHSSIQMEDVMPEIESFVEIGSHFDQPLRTYSSGMRMRLAFGVVTAFRPDVLIIDEALAVGDAYFRHKSFAKIREFKDQGTSMIIVSHDRGSIQVLCETAVLIHGGVVAKYGPAESVLDYYHALIADKEKSLISQKVLPDGRIQTISGTGEAEILAVAISSDKDNLGSTFEVNDNVRLKISVHINKDLPKLVAGFMIKDSLGQPVFGTNTEFLDVQLTNLKADEITSIVFKFSLSIGAGSYSIATALSKSDSHLDENYEWRDLALIFSIVNRKNKKFAGVVCLNPTVSVVKEADVNEIIGVTVAP